MTDLLQRAFLALGPGASWRELQLVADRIRESGDEDALATLEAAAAAVWGGDEDRHAMDELADLAKASGSSGFDALNLVVEVLNPDAHAHLRSGDRGSMR